MEVQEMKHQLARSQEILHFLQQHKGNDLFASNAEWLPLKRELDEEEVCLFHIEQLTFEEKAPRREAMENILGMFRGVDGVSFIYLILGNKQGVSFYFGVARDQESQLGKLTIPTLGKHVLQPGIQGNFRGCEVEMLDNDAKAHILQEIRGRHQAGLLLGVPGTEQNKDQESFQGVDRLIDVMADDKFGFMIIARPYTEAEMDGVEQQLIAIADALMPLTRHTLQQVSSNSNRTVQGTNDTSSQQSGSSTHKTEGTAKSSTESKTHAQQDHYGNQQTDTTSKMATENASENKSSGYGNNEDDRKGSSDTSGSSHQTHESHDTTKGTSESSNRSISTSIGTQHQASYAFSHTVSQTESANEQSSKTKSLNQSISTDTSDTKMTSKSETSQEESGDSFSYQEQLEVEAKSATQWVKYLDEVLLPRLDYGRGKGLFLSCGYLFARDASSLTRLANTAISLFSGPKGNQTALRFHAFSGKGNERACEIALQNLQLPRLVHTNFPANCAVALSLENKGDLTSGGSWLSAKELSIIAGLPQKEVTGLALREEVDFGLNVQPIAPENQIILGNLVQNGNVRTELPVCLDKKALDKHMFVTGVTGSGKTTTCQNILLDCHLPFLVIEPAKTEYRALATKCPDIVYFTPGLQDVAPFFLNPFELSPGETIASRADMIKATFTASFQMEAAIPQILETAVYRAYEDKKWDINTNTWQPHGEPEDPYAVGQYAFPTLADYCKATIDISKEAGFGDRLQAEYIGSIKARLESLMVGAKGMMLNTPRSLDFADLVDKKVVIELEEIKNGAEKSLLMGLILTNLMQAVKQKHHENPNFQHITLIEEAHRLLSRYVPGDSMNKKQGVEVFADMLAEVRKYGESFIIADQIPDKMTPEVLKNTNTKIVHKLFARDDKDAIGDTMALDDDQKSFLSKLPVGRAVMFSQGWEKAIQVQVELKTKTTGVKEIEPEIIHQLSLQYYAQPHVIQRGVLPGIERLSMPCDEQTVEKYLQMMLIGKQFQVAYKKLANEVKAAPTTRGKSIAALRANLLRLESKQKMPREIWQTCLFALLYPDFDSQKQQDFNECMQQLLLADTEEKIKTFQKTWKSKLQGSLQLDLGAV